MAARKVIFSGVVVGDEKVGKTSFLKTLRQSFFEEDYVPTENVGKINLNFNSKQGEAVIFKCYDCVGNDEYGGLRKDNIKRKIQWAIILFDPSNKTSLESALSYKRNIGKRIPTILLCSKSDLVDEKNEEMRGLLKYIKISSKNNYQLDLPFKKIAKKFNLILE